MSEEHFYKVRHVSIVLCDHGGVRIQDVSQALFDVIHHFPNPFELPN